MATLKWIRTSKDFCYAIFNERKMVSVEFQNGIYKATIYSLTAGGAISERENYKPWGHEFYTLTDAKNWLRHHVMSLNPEKYFPRMVGYEALQPLYNNTHTTECTAPNRVRIIRNNW